MKDEESEYRDEYLQLIEHLQTTYPPGFNIEDVSPDLICSLMRLEFFVHLYYLFELCCFCNTVPSPSYPALAIINSTTYNSDDRFTEVILSGQSYMAGVPDSVTHCCNETNMATFSLLSTDFADDYDPWTFVDAFGRPQIYKTLLCSCIKQLWLGQKYVPLTVELQRPRVYRVTQPCLYLVDLRGDNQAVVFLD